MTEHPKAQAIFAEYGIEVVPANVIPGNGQTRAIATLDHIRNRHGEAHARFVVMTLSEKTANNRAFIDETSLWVISDIVRAAEKNYPIWSRITSPPGSPSSTVCRWDGFNTGLSTWTA